MLWSVQVCRQEEIPLCIRLTLRNILVWNIGPSECLILEGLGGGKKGCTVGRRKNLL